MSRNFASVLIFTGWWETASWEFLSFFGGFHGDSKEDRLTEVVDAIAILLVWKKAGEIGVSCTDD